MCYNKFSGDGMGKLSNILTMAELLNSGRKYSINELSDILEVTTRMIRFYKEELEIAGIYIDTIRGPYGGYVLNQKTRVPSRKFNNDDIQLLSEIKELVSDINQKEKFHILIDKIRGIYIGSPNEKKELDLNDENLNKYNIFSRAIKEKKKVKIIYYSYNKGERERIIHPYNMFLYTDGWGVASFCEYKQDLRHFEFKRMSKVDLLEENY